MTTFPHGILTQIGGTIANRWKGAVGGLSVLAVVGVVDGIFYYSTLGVPFLEYADWGDFARVGVFGGLFASLLSIALGIVALLVLLPITVLVLVMASTFRNQPGSWLSRVRATVVDSYDWAMGLGVYGTALGCVTYTLVVTAYVALHREQAEFALRAASEPLSSRCWLSPAAGIEGRDSSECGIVEWLWSLRSPDLSSPLSVRSQDGRLASKQPLAFAGKLGEHYVYLRMTAGEDEQPGTARGRTLPFVVLKGSISTIEAYPAESVVAPSVAALRLDLGLPTTWVIEPAETRFNFAVHFEGEQQQELSPVSQELLDEVGRTLSRCVDKFRPHRVELLVRGEVSSAGFPDTGRHTPESVKAQIELARNRELAIRDHLSKYLDRSLINTSEPGAAEPELIVGPYEDRPTDSYDTNLGLLNRNGWVTVYLQAGACALSSEATASVSSDRTAAVE